MAETIDESQKQKFTAFHTNPRYIVLQHHLQVAMHDNYLKGNFYKRHLTYYVLRIFVYLIEGNSCQKKCSNHDKRCDFRLHI